jgi:hypothetical protein
VKNSNLLEKTLNLIRMQPGCTTIDVARTLHIPSGKAVEVLHKLIADGSVQRRLGRRLYQYYLVEDVPPKIVA